MTDQPSAFDAYAVVELNGHRRIVGRVREVQIAGGPMLQLTEWTKAGDGQVHLFNRASIYAMHPCTEDLVRQSADDNRWEPIPRHELAATAWVDPWGDGRPDADDSDILAEYDDEGDAPGIPITMTPDGPRVETADLLAALAHPDGATS